MKKLHKKIAAKATSVYKKNAQTKATEKYQKKAGLINKSFKLKKELVEEFKETCDALEVSQASALTGLMKQFISENRSFLK